VKIPLARSKAGHLWVNLTQGWLTLSRPLQPEPAEEAYMVRSLGLEVEATGHEVHIIKCMNMSEKPLLTAVGESHHFEDVRMMNEDGDEGDAG